MKNKQLIEELQKYIEELQKYDHEVTVFIEKKEDNNKLFKYIIYDECDKPKYKMIRIG